MVEVTLADAQERLIDSVCGPQWAPVRKPSAPFASPRCGAGEDIARKAAGPAAQVHTAAGTVELARGVSVLRAGVRPVADHASGGRESGGATSPTGCARLSTPTTTTPLTAESASLGPQMSD